MKITKLSTRGQIVIPEEIRGDLDIGTSFVVTKKDNLIILKKIEGLTNQEIEEMGELDKVWKEIDEGRGTTMDVENFLKEMKSW